MKKTFTINISGSVFHIEEDAFEKLQNYLQQLSRYFGNQPAGQEILQDIESRIAELLQEKQREGLAAVTAEWVDEVIRRMGNPEDFMEQDQVQSNANANDSVKKEKIKKRMYRDGENRVLGGVCSGMSAYFTIDPVFLRILFILLVFVGVGVSVIVYLILWLVVPEAKTTAQRLEMRGEEATITNIQKTIQEEVGEVKKSFSRINQSEPFRKGREFATKAGQASVQLMKRLGKTFEVVFGSFLILTGFIGFVAILVSFAVGNSTLFSNSAGINQEVDFTGFLGLIVSPGLVSIAVLLLVLLIGIPLLAILFVGTKLVFRYKTNNKLIGLGSFGIWLFALVVLLAVSAGQTSNFSQKNAITSAKALHCPTCQTLYLELATSPDGYEDQNGARFENFSLITVNGEKVMAGNPRLQIEATEAADFSVSIKKTARGKNKTDVQKNIDNIRYAVTGHDSTLIIDPYFLIENQAKWRNQEVQLTVRVPEGKSVHLAENLHQLHFDFENINNIWDKDMAGKTWIMTPEGLSLKQQKQ